MINNGEKFLIPPFSHPLYPRPNHAGALYSLENNKLRKPVLVSACDGVGTKIKLATELNNFEGIFTNSKIISQGKQFDFY